MDLATAIDKRNLKSLHEQLDKYDFAPVSTTELALGAIQKNWTRGLEVIFSKCPIGGDGLEFLLYQTFKRPTQWGCLRLILSHPQIEGRAVREAYLALVQGVTGCPGYQPLIEADFIHLVRGWAEDLPPLQLSGGAIPPRILRALNTTNETLHHSQITAALDMPEEEAKEFIRALYPHCDPTDMIREAIYTGDYEWVLDYLCGELGHNPEINMREVQKALAKLETFRPRSQGATVWDHIDEEDGV